MTTTQKSYEELEAEITELRNQLDRAQQSLNAIGRGEVDAFVVPGLDGDRLYTLNTADRSYRLLVEAMNEGAATLAEDGTILYCNSRLSIMLEASLEQLIGTQLGTYVIPSCQPIFTAQLKKSSRERIANEIVMRTAKNRLLPVLVSSSAFNLSGNRELCLVVADITQQKSLKSLEGILQTAMDGFWMTDLQGRFLKVNESYCRMSGYSEQELLTMSIPDIVTDLTSDEVAIRIQEVMAHGNGLFESRQHRRNGTEFLVEISVQHQHDEGGRFVFFLRDITDRKKTEEQLRKSENQYRTLFEMMDEGFCVVDLIYDSSGKPVDFRFLETNPAFVKQTGLHQALGKTMRQLVPDFEDFWFETYDEVIRTGEPKRFENHTAAMDRFYDVFAFCIGVEEKQIVGILFDDITNRKKAEAEKANLENQLNQAQKMEAIGQLAGGVAHDFNNKLMAILGNAQLAKMDIHDSEKVLNYLDEIRRAAEHSRDITFRLLAFSRQQVVTPLVLDANKIITDSIKTLSRLIGEHISISFEPSDKLWNIRMDPVQLDQIVMNLAINARDAMPDGGSLLIETRNTTYNTSCSSSIDAVPGDYVMVTFSDTGTGMDKETLKHIFEPFFTTKEVGKGTGLGLATIYGITRQNSGFIDVSSNVGYGTEFRVYIPRFSASKIETAKVADTLCTGSCSILLVEDENEVRSVTSQFLRKIGYTVYEAATPRAALELARDFSIQIDLVLTDFLMPEMSGRVMMEQILELRPQLQCIYASGFTTEHVLLSKDANFIQKPYDFVKLSGYLKQVLGGSEER